MQLLKCLVAVFLRVDWDEVGEKYWEMLKMSFISEMCQTQEVIPSGCNFFLLLGHMYLLIGVYKR